ncbi:MAG: low molecular weight phosphatase family protein [Ruminococcus sp.]|nr:low molecular weight phosphatase family protein [Ruminococcus sp.]
MMQRDKKQCVAFVCTGNTCRSPMAEAIFNKLAGEKNLDVYAVSFGMAAASGVPVSALSVRACEEIGIDLSGKKASFIYNYDIDGIDKFYCMSEEHKNMLVQFCGVPEEKIEVLGITDPFGGNFEVYRQCRDEIYNSVQELIKEYEN